jgi:arylsulfatase
VTLFPYTTLFRSSPVDRKLCWEHEGNRAIRDGKYKLVSRHPQGWELYDMEADRTELNELSGEMPEKAAQMLGDYEAWAKRCGVVPWSQFQKKDGKKKNG